MGGLPKLYSTAEAAKWKDYRAKERFRYKTMTLASDEFMRHFLLHVLPSGFHRIQPLRTDRQHHAQG